MKLSLILLVLPLAICEGSLLVRTKQGFLIGRKADFEDASANVKKSVAKFVGIPFAAPPIGKLRFQKTQSTTAYKGVKYATEPKPACPQLKIDPKTMQPDPNDYEGSEDCLYLDVYAPYGSKGKDVMIYIHGGGFVGGYSKIFNSVEMAAKGDVVIVVIQYRLGVFGFLKGNHEKIPGNVGLWDQVEAIRWVHENIDRFGGDPNKITIWGESAGGMSVGFHLITPHTKDYYRHAIMESGSTYSVLAMMNEKISDDAFVKFVKGMNGTLDPQNKATQETINQLDALSTQDIMTYVATKSESIVGNFFPSSDIGSGSHCFFCGRILNISDDATKISQLNLHDKKILMGTNSNEGAGFILLPHIYPTDKNGDTSKYPKTFQELDNSIPPFRKDLRLFMKAELFKNAQTPNEIRDRLVMLYNSFMFQCPDKLMLNHLINDLKDTYKGSIYYYHFDYMPTNPANSMIMRGDAGWLQGALHAEELCMFFNDPSKNLKTDQDRKLSNQMIDMWTQFAKTGVPTIVGEPSFNPKPVNEEPWTLLDIPRTGDIRAVKKASNDEFPQGTMCHNGYIDLKYYKEFIENGKL